MYTNIQMSKSLDDKLIQFTISQQIYSLIAENKSCLKGVLPWYNVQPTNNDPYYGSLNFILI